jgi:polyhydroxyalkanoate synthesis regulator phasin
MEIHKLIKAKEKGKLVIDSCLSIDQLEFARIYVEQFYTKFNDLVSYSELNILINNKKEKLKEMKTLKNIMYAGLGLMHQADDKLKGQFNMLVDKGKKIDKKGNNLVKEYFKIIDVIKESMGKKFSEEINSKIERIEDFLQTIKR